jgi:hypothetical protein
MASIEEVYRPCGIIHTDNCGMCKAVEDEEKRTYKRFEGVTLKLVDRILIGTLILGVGFFIGVLVTWEPLQLERLLKEYNHFQMYEDGSYVGETKEGLKTTGCIVGGQCKD